MENSCKFFIFGRIDTQSADKFRKTTALLTEGVTEVIFDFSNVDYVSSAGLREILICQKKFPDMRIENVNKLVFEIFKSTGFDEFITMTCAEETEPNFDGRLNEFEVAENSTYAQVSFRKFLRDKATSSADKIAVVHAGKKYSWRDIDFLSNRIAVDLAEKNVGKGSHVAICGANSINWILTFFALQKLGAIAILVNFNLSVREISAIVDYADITHFCYGEMSAEIDDLKNFLGYKVQTFYSFRNDVNFQSDNTVENNLNIIVHADDPAVMIFTSGTTGKLKGVLLSAYNIINAAQINAHDQTLRGDDKSCVILPFFHIFGLIAGIFANALAGSTIYLPEKLRSNSIMELIYRENITVFHSVPTMFLALINNQNFSMEKVSSLRCSIISGAHMTAEQIENLQRLMPNNHFMSSYGLSEMAPVSITEYDDSRENILYTVGKPVKNIRIKIFEPDSNGVGEILVQGFNLMTGYYKLSPEAQSIDADGWLHTGDLGTIDADGYLRLTGRIKDIIVRGGENIYPAEVESVISEDKNIAEVKVLGVPHDFWGEVVCACIKIKSANFDENKLRELLANRLAKYKNPEYFLVYDEFPLLGSGKIDAAALKKNALDRLGIIDNPVI